MVRRVVQAISACGLVFSFACNKQELVSGGVESDPGDDPDVGELVPDEPTPDLLPEGHYAFRDLFQQTMIEEGKVDVLWVIDTSGSMQDEQTKLGTAFGSFIQGFLDLGLDFHMAITTSDTSTGRTREGEKGMFLGATSILTSEMDPADVQTAFQATILAGTNGSGNEMGLQGAKLALSEPMLSSTTNQGFLREDALLSVIIVSDEEDHSNLTNLQSSAASDAEPVQTYHDFFVALKGGDPELYHLSVITGDDMAGYTYSPDQMSSCDSYFGYAGNTNSAQPGQRYAAAAALANGLEESICEPDFAPAVARLGDVISVLAKEKFKMTHVPVPGTVIVRIDGVEVAAGPDTWQWDEAANAIVFADGAEPTECAALEIGYQTTDPTFDPHDTTGGDGVDPSCASTTPGVPTADTPDDPTGVDQTYPYEPPSPGSASLGGGGVSCAVSGTSRHNLATLIVLAGLVTLQQRRRRHT